LRISAHLPEAIDLKRYGDIEWEYARPIAEALASSPQFKTWLLSQTRFAPLAENAVLLHEEMKMKRSATAETWWRSHFTEKCRCEGCSGQETDLLAIFQSDEMRFALHVEVKQPKDNFRKEKDQSRNYALRAACWARAAPAKVLDHDDADTLLIFSEKRRQDYSKEIEEFGASVSFEDIWGAFPEIMPISEK